MVFSRASVLAAAAALAPVALAQTSTLCNPLEKTCPSDPALGTSDFTADFRSGASSMAAFSTAEYETVGLGSLGAEFSIDKSGEAPTISTDFYFLFGRVDVTMRAAPGTGIISSIVLESDDLDEIDWEFTGGDTTQVQSNFFGKGNTTVYDRVQYISVASPQDTFHTYSLDWTASQLQWIIDGTVVRTLSATDPLTLGGKNYPQTPMRLKLGNWCGGCAGEAPGTIQWAGGDTTFQGAPYVMYVQSVSIHNNNPAHSYTYGDNSGTWQSIQMNGASSGGSSAGNASSAAVPTSSITVVPVTNTAVVASTTILANTSTISHHASSSTGSSGSPTTAGTAGQTSSVAVMTPTASATGVASKAALSGASLLVALFGFLLL